LERLTDQTIETYLQDAAIEEFANAITQSVPAYRDRKGESSELCRAVIQSEAFRQGLQSILSRTFSTQDMMDLVTIYEIGERNKNLQEKMVLIGRQEEDFLENLLITANVSENMFSINDGDISALYCLINQIVATRLQEETVHVPFRPLLADRSQSRWYFTQSKSGTVKLEDIGARLEKSSSLSAGDINNVLIQLGDFGTFRISVSSEGAESAEALTARNIKKAKLVFLPSTKLKQKLSTLAFEVVE
jgi:hypothetical protein